MTSNVIKASAMTAGPKDPEFVGDPSEWPGDPGKFSVPVKLPSETTRDTPLTLGLKGGTLTIYFQQPDIPQTLPQDLIKSGIEAVSVPISAEDLGQEIEVAVPIKQLGGYHFAMILDDGN